MCEQTLIHTCSQEYPGSARCVQSFDDSLDSAIRITYRISLRSSSMREPRHPSLKVVWHSVSPRRRVVLRSCEQTTTHARGSDCSQSRNGGRLIRFWLLCVNIKSRLPAIGCRSQDLHQVRFPSSVHRVLVWMFSCDE